MIFNKHSEFEGEHAFLSPSSYAWTNYDTEKLKQRWLSFMTVKRGTELHDLARRMIELGVSLPKNKKTLNQYVNDALAYRMTSEQILLYSPNCFGTADAISFRNNQLRIHDLKTGQNPASMTQLQIYAALFCLEYDKKPGDIDIVLRIYQNDSVEEQKPESKVIYDLMKKIVDFDKVLKDLKQEYRVND